VARVISLFTDKVNTYFLTFFTFHLLAPSSECAGPSSQNSSETKVLELVRTDAGGTPIVVEAVGADTADGKILFSMTKSE
jgi:hypothetical protein